jgi:hypothetical protein
MLLLGFNVKDSKSLPFENTIIAFMNWITKAG